MGIPSVEMLPTQSGTDFGVLQLETRAPKHLLWAMSDAISLVHKSITENQLGHFEAALKLAEQAVRQGQGGVAAYLCAAFAAAKLQGNEASLAWFNRALATHPLNTLALGGRANLLLTMDRPADGLEDCRRWAALDPQNGTAHLCLAQTYQALGRDEEALLAYANASDRLAEPAETLTDWSILLLEMGRRDDGLKVLDRAFAADSGFAAAWYTRSNSKKSVPGDPDTEAMEALLPATPPQERRAVRAATLLHYALAKAYTDQLAIPQALAHLAAGSRLKRAEYNYDSNIDAATMASLAAAFSAQTIEHLRSSGNPSELPLFILGMPRSGTSLVEQILASHPLVYGGGESPRMDALVQELGADYPQKVAELTEERRTAMAYRYLADLAAKMPPAAGVNITRFTDKMPYNFLHVGLIHILFPQARIIHCVRNPLDTCLSCYTTLFTHGHEFSYDLTEAGLYYRNYAQLMAHWRERLPADRLIEVTYENVVDDIEAQARRLVKFCGLPWSDECLRFHESNRPVRTASLHQVRQPLYRGSVGRAALFADGLAPLRAALGDLI
jgi:tetratricopeptide (TPR) repeat protein